MKPADTAPPPPVGSAAPTLDGTIGIQSGGGSGLTIYATFPLTATKPASTDPCTLRSDTGASDSAEPDADAGDVIVDLVTDVGPETLTLTYDPAAKSYTSATGDVPTTQGTVLQREAIHVRTTGGAILAIDTHVLPVSDLALSAPADHAKISPASDLALAWAPVADEGILASLYSGATNRTIACRFGAETGSATVPASLVSAWLEGAAPGACAGDCTTLVTSSFRTAEVTAGDYRVHVLALSGVSRVLDIGK